MATRLIPTTKTEFLKHQETKIQQLREKILIEFNTLGYVKMNSLIQEVKRRKVLLQLTKIGKITEFFIQT